MESNEKTRMRDRSEKGLAVLVIDDDELLCEVTRRFLSDTGYSVYTAESGEEGLKHLSTRPDEIALVITDMGLPGLGGAELLEKIHNLNASIKIIAMSGYGGQEMLREIGGAWLSKFLPKPFSREELLKVVESFIGPPR